MGQTNLTRLNVALTATTGPFSKSIQQAHGIVEKFGDGLKEKLLHPITLIAEALSAGALIEGIKHSTESIDQLAKSADRLGISTEAFAGFQHAAELSGTSIEALRGGMEKLSKNVEEAATGNKAAIANLGAFNLKVEDLVGLKPDEQFMKIADSFNALSTQGQKSAAVLGVFGRGGGELINTLSLGSKGLEEMTEDAIKLGKALSRQDAAKVEAVNDAFHRMKESIEGVFNRLTIALAPFLVDAANALTNFFSKGSQSAATMGKVIESLNEAVGGLIMVFQSLSIALQTIWVGASYVALGFYKIKAALAGSSAELPTFSQALKNLKEDLSSIWDNGNKGFDVMAAGIKLGAAKVVDAAQTLSEGAHFKADHSALAAAQKEYDDVAGAAVKSAEKRNEFLKGLEDQKKEREANAEAEIAKAKEKSNGELLLADKQLSEAQGKLHALTATNWAATYHDWTVNVLSDIGTVGNAASNAASKAKADAIKAQQEAAAAAAKQQADGIKMLSGWLDTMNTKVTAFGANIRTQFQTMLGQQFDDQKAGLNQAQIAENDAFALRLQNLTAYHEQRMATNAEYDALVEEAKTAHELRYNAIALTAAQQRENWDRIGGRERLAMWGSTFSSLMILAQGHSKKVFEISKAGALGAAIMDTAAGVAKTFQQLGWAAMFGPAEAVAAAGAVQIATIAAQKYGGGASGSSNVSAAAGAASSLNSGGGGQAAPARNGQTVVLQGDSFSAEALMKLFAEAKERGFQIDGVRRG